MYSYAKIFHCEFTSTKANLHEVYLPPALFYSHYSPPWPTIPCRSRLDTLTVDRAMPVTAHGYAGHRYSPGAIFVFTSISA